MCNLEFEQRFLYRKEKWGYILQDTLHDRLWAVDEETLLRAKKGDISYPFFSNKPYQYNEKFEIGNVARRDTISAPVSVSWSITAKCNSRCCFCCTNSINSASPSHEASTEEIERVLQVLSRWGVTRIIIGGGEPLMRKDISEILGLFRRYNMKPALATNGILFTEKLIKEAVDTCMNIQISLDTLKRERYCALRGIDGLEIVKNNIYQVSRNNVLVRIVTVLTKENKDELLDISDFLAECGIRQWFIFELLESGRGKSCYERLHIEAFPCIRETIQSIRERHPDLSVWYWGNKKADGCSVYVNPDGSLNLVDYHKNSSQVFRSGDLDLQYVKDFWNQISDDDKKKMLDNFLSKDRLWSE